MILIIIISIMCIIIVMDITAVLLFLLLLSDLGLLPRAGHRVSSVTIAISISIILY